MIKIVHFMPNVNYTSGIANFVMNYYRQIDKSKIQFDFLIFGKENFPNFEQEIRSLGGEVIRISPPTNYRKFHKQINNYFERQDCSNIIFHNHQISFTIFLYGITRAYNIKRFIVHNHMTKYSDKLISSIRNFILCIPIKYMNVIQFSCSEEAGKRIFNNQKKVFVVNNAISTEKYKFDIDIRKKIRLEYNFDNTFVIGHVGRFEKVKNHKFIITIFKKIANSNHDVKLLLVGNGKYKEKMIKKIKKYKLYNDVVIIENSDDIPSLLMAMDVFIFPSKFEGLGIAAVEAQATGLPVILSDKVPAITSQCTVDVLAINKKNVDIWVRTIYKYKNYRSDRTLGNDTIANSVFDIIKNAKILEKIYYEIMKK